MMFREPVVERDGITKRGALRHGALLTLARGEIWVEDGPTAFGYEVAVSGPSLKCAQASYSLRGI